MSDSYVGEIRLFPFNYAPYGWALCAGQLMMISSNTALFSLLGTNYGGDGARTFALPNLQGQVLINQGQAASGNQYYVGETGGAASVTLLQTEMPSHTHSFNVNTADGTQPGSSNAQLSKASAGGRGHGGTDANLYTPNAPNVQLSPTVLGAAGGSMPHNNLQPYLAMTYCICLQGVFPPRS